MILFRKCGGDTPRLSNLGIQKARAQVDSGQCGQLTFQCVNSGQFSVWTVDSSVCEQWTVQCVDS